MSVTAKHIIFKGNVQGVGFRFTAHAIASRCSVKGWVKNIPDGSVEMLAQGHSDNIQDCIDSLKDTYRDGITEVIITEIPVDANLKEFKITF